MPKPDLTPAQREAVETLDRDVCVSAGAGSGKTRVLVERFCRIVESDQAAVGEILTVTFTEKAAREMKQRIVERFADLAREAEDETRRRREQDRRDVETAYIGTIHGFCARVLRENALEAGVDPRFNILDAPAAEALRREALDDALGERFEKNPTGSAELAEVLGREGLREAALTLHDRARRLGLSPGELQFDAPAPLEERAASLAAAVSALSRPLVILNGAKRSEESRTRGDPSPPAQDDISRSSISPALRRRLAALEDAWRQAEVALESGATWEAIDAVRDVRGAIDKRGDQETKRLVEELRMAADSVTKAIVGSLAAKHLPALQALLASLERHYRERKNARGGLDYDDLLILTRDLLAGDSPTAHSYRRAIKFILMDEFQDTNRLQMEVIDAIRRSPPGNLFVVGDAKQSIFGFNDADVGVFLERREAMEREGTGKVIPMVENFRSRPELIGFVNQVCADIWEEDEDFKFEALKASGKFADDPLTAPRVEVIALPRQDAKVDDVRQEEARALALRIRQLAGEEGEAAMRLTRADHRRDLKYADILVLFRATTAVPIYERALFDAGVPYYVVSGRGFYATPEVQNLANLLRVVHQPLDDYALAGVLRSPLCEVSDDTLYWLARAGGDGRKCGRLWRALAGTESIAEIDEDQRGRLVHLRELIHALQAMAPGAPLSRMIDRAVEDTDYGAKMLAQHSGKRRYANVRKLIEVAQQVEGSTAFGLGEFLDYLSSLTVLAERETEAPTEAERSNVVRLMTIHMAKGLEAPVVFIPDLAHAIQSRPGNFLIDEQKHVAIRLRNPLTEEWLPTSAHCRAVEWLEQRERNEYKRLFYVALTRAEERLILIGGFGFKEGKSDSNYRDLGRWSEWVEKALGLEGPSEQERHLDLTPDRAVTVSVRGAMSATPPDRSRHRHFRDHYREQVEAGEPVADLPPEAAIAAEGAAARARWQLPAAAGPPPRLSVTALLDYEICPRLYQLRHLLGIDEGPPMRRGPSARRLGALAHETLARYDFAAAPKGDAAVERLDCDDETRRRIAAMIDRFRGTPVFRRIREAAERYPEIRFELPAEGTIIRGVLDLLFRSHVILNGAQRSEESRTGRAPSPSPQNDKMRPGRDGRWTVLDYKTGEITDAARYDLQVAVYAYAVAEITGDRPARVLLVPLSGGEAYDKPVDDLLLESARAEIARLVAGIAEARFDRRAGEQCARCPYRGRFCAG